MKQSLRFKFKHIALFLVGAYLLMCQSCMTMRLTTSETASYFKTQKVTFVDETVVVDGFHLHYIQTGDYNKPTLFFVHGSPGSWDAYKRYLTDSLLLKKYRMIAIDRPGFGTSDFGQAENLAAQTKLIEGLVSKIDNQQPIVLIGHSLGGPVVVKMAADKPQLFHNLVVLAGAVDPHAETPEVWRPILNASPIRYLIPGALRPSNAELWWLKSDLYDLQPLLKNITAAVTIIHGTKDPLVPFKNMQFMNDAFVRAKSIHNIAIENANHYIPWEHFDLIRDTLLHLSL